MDVLLLYSTIIENVDSVDEAVRKAIAAMRNPSITATFDFEIVDNNGGGGIVDFTPNGEVKITSQYP